jgi:hypothetical protein
MVLPIQPISRNFKNLFLLDACQGQREISYFRLIKGQKKEVKAVVNADNPGLKV